MSTAASPSDHTSWRLTDSGDVLPSRVAAARARMADGDWPTPLAVADAILASGLLSVRLT